MPATAEKCVQTILNKIKDTFEGFGDDAVEEFHNIMIVEVKSLVNDVRKETLTSVAQNNSAEPAQPRLKRVTNYTMFGVQFRKDNPDVTENVFQEIAKAWKKCSKADKAEWKARADAENERLKEEYLEKYGELPKKNRRKNRPKTTNPFREYVKYFRTKNPKVGHKEVFGEASKAWKKLSEKQRQKYVDQSDELRAQWKAEWEEEQKNNPVVEEVMGKKKRPRKQRPKTKSGYIMFGSYWRENLNKQKLTGQEAMSAIGKAWGALSKKEQNKYNAEASKENETIVQAFLKEHPDSEYAQNHAQSTSA